MNETNPAAAARPQGPRVHAKEYETIYILRSDVDTDAAERVQARVADALEREHGKLVKVEAWGRRKLAYPVGKQRKGVYVYLKYAGGGGLVQEVERNLKLQDAVIKYMTVQTAEDVDVTTLQIDPEETKLGKLELAPEEEEKESREKQLGLIELGPEAPKARREDIEEFEPEDVVEGTTAREEESRAMAMMDDDRDITRGPDLNAEIGRRRGVKKRICRYCADKALVIDYKDPQALKYFVSDRGKIVPRRISGNCARHQRKVQLAVKRARNVALLPFTVTH